MINPNYMDEICIDTMEDILSLDDTKSFVIAMQTLEVLAERQPKALTEALQYCLCQATAGQDYEALGIVLTNLLPEIKNLE
jgi:hypothetical protein